MLQPRWGEVYAPRGLEFVHLDSPGPQSITALSRGRGYGEAGGEGLFCSCKISESLTHRCAVPPLPQAGEGYCQLIFRGQDKMYKLQTQGLRHGLLSVARFAGLTYVTNY